MSKPTKNRRQRQAFIRIVTMVLSLVCVNILASYLHKGFDLTKENRFTLSEPTIKLLKNMQEVAVIDIYMKGKFPADIQRMQESVQDKLRSFKEFAGNKIIFRFIDPLEGKSDKQQQVLVHDFEQKGLHFYPLQSKEDEGYSLKIFCPYALVQYNNKEIPVLLLESPPGKSSEEKMAYAEGMLEYKFAYAINFLSKANKPKVGYLTGNGEILDIHSADMLFKTLPYYYQIDTIDINHINHISLAYDAVIINQPTQQFEGPQKLKIDQYLIHGGHVLLSVNSLKTSLDSFANSPQFIALEYGLDLDDLLFKYGIRINNDLIEDKQCAPLPRTMNGQVELRDWVYFPRLNPTSHHPIVRNMDFVLGGFTNSIDTVSSNNVSIRKTVLLQSSKYSRTSSAPVRVSLSMMNYAIPDKLYNNPYRPVAVLLEGNFVSAYDRRLAPEFIAFLDSVQLPFKRKCDTPTSMIVTTVGNIFANDYTIKDGPLPMGYYKYSGGYFENKSFLLNCLEYLTDKSGILEARSKQVKLRLLDSGRVKEESKTWQVVNLGLPIAAVLVFASFYLFFRKRRYETKS